MPSPKNPRKKDNIPASDNPGYIKKTYSTIELLHILTYAEKIDFSNTEVFRKEESTTEEKELFLKLMQVQMFQDHTIPPTTKVDISDLTLSMILEPRASLNIDSEHLPYVVATLIKRALYNWEFIDDETPISVQFKRNFADIYEEIQNIVSVPLITSKEKSHRIKKLLAPLNEYQHPQIQYKLKMLPIALITDLTAHGFINEAKALHQFFRLTKVILEKNVVISSDHEKTLRMLAPSILSGLKLPFETDPQAYPIVSGMLLMTIKEPLFNEDYDPDIYMMYHQINSKIQMLNIGIESSPSILSENIKSSLPNIIRRHYADVIKDFFPTEKPEIRDQAVLNFLTHTISVYCQFDRSTKGEDIHNILYLLQLVYADNENKNSEQNIKLFSKLFRNLLHLPASEFESDIQFDQVVINSIFGDPHNPYFKKPFKLKTYGLTPSESKQYCVQLHNTLCQTQLENSELRIKLIELQDRLERAETDYSTVTMQMDLLQKRQAKGTIEPSPANDVHHYKRALSDGALNDRMSALSVEDEEGVSPLTSPSHSPPTPNSFLKHFKRKKKSVEEPEPHHEPEELIYKRTLSEGAFSRKKKK